MSALSEDHKFLPLYDIDHGRKSACRCGWSGGPYLNTMYAVESLWKEMHMKNLPTTDLRKLDE